MSTPATIKCPACGGTGAKNTLPIDLMEWTPCQRCIGTGSITITENDEEAE